ncbi:MAG: radical SAM protein [Deltaproteobacteria bacterium]|nr:radical SAM protein [Deltaproteobacteria bacterium]
MIRTLSKFAINFKYAFRPGKPLLVLRLIQTFLGVFLLGKRPLRYVDMAIDYRCNLRCDHCFKVSLERQDTEAPRLTIKDYERIVRECMELGAVNFSFQGGEIFLYPDWETVILACQPKKNVISVTTNGTMLTDDNLKRLKAVGVDILTISLDSAIPEEHDRFRGVKGTFNKVISGIDASLEKGFSVTIGTTVSHANLRSEGITKLIQMAIKKKVILNLILAVPAGRWQDNMDILVTDEDMQYIRGIIKQSPYIRTDFEANFVSWGCGALKEILYLTPYGDLLPCPFMHISFGNVLKESVADIRKRGLENRYFKDYHGKCLVAEDKEFIEKYITKTFDKKLPVSDKEVFW